MKTERDFDAAMMNIYLKAKKIGYGPSIFHRMLVQHGGLTTAKRLVNSSAVSDGYTRLYEMGRLDITVEAVIYENKKWHELFTPEEIEICRKRLTDYQYSPKSPT